MPKTAFTVPPHSRIKDFWKGLEALERGLGLLPPLEKPVLRIIDGGLATTEQSK